MKSRPRISVDLEADVLYKSDHTCSVCRTRGIGVQIHHIDGDPTHNTQDNLMVLCLEDHNKASSRSPLSKAYTPIELKKYRTEWEKIVQTRREALIEPSKITLVRFDGVDRKIVYLETRKGVLRRFIDSKTFVYLGFEWGNIDVYLEQDKTQFLFEEPLTKLSDCRKIRLKFSDGSFASQVYLIWDDGRKHHIPDPETLHEIGGAGIEAVDHKAFNAIPHGDSLKSIYEVRNKQLLQEAMKKSLGN
jgi:hypothetical protein